MESDARKLLRIFKLPKAVDVLAAVYGWDGAITAGYITTVRGKCRLTVKGRARAITLLRRMFNTWISQIRGKAI